MPCLPFPKPVQASPSLQRAAASKTLARSLRQLMPATKAGRDHCRRRFDSNTRNGMCASLNNDVRLRAIFIAKPAMAHSSAS